MPEAISISEQLRARRKELGWSLAETARRAGTSAASLSRYEHAWTRFEMKTLRKLASALNCRVRVSLEPAARPSIDAVADEELVKQLQRLFWDVPFTPDALKAYPSWAVERVLEFGQLADVQALAGWMGRESFLDAAAVTHRMSPRTRALWTQILAMERS